MLECPYCERIIQNSSALRMHIEKKHGLKAEPFQKAEHLQEKAEKGEPFNLQPSALAFQPFSLQPSNKNNISTSYEEEPGQEDYGICSKCNIKLKKYQPCKCHLYCHKIFCPKCFGVHKCEITEDYQEEQILSFERREPEQERKREPEPKQEIYKEPGQKIKQEIKPETIFEGVSVCGERSCPLSH